MSSVIYAFKRLQCLYLHFKDFNVFSHLRFQRLQCLYLHYKTSMSSVFYILQDFNVFCLLHFIRLQPLLSFIRLNVLIFVLLRTQRPLFLCFQKRKTSNVFCSIGLPCPPFLHFIRLQCPFVYRFFFLGFRQLPIRTKLVSLFHLGTIIHRCFNSH